MEILLASPDELVLVYPLACAFVSQAAVEAVVLGDVGVVGLVLPLGWVEGGGLYLNRGLASHLNYKRTYNNSRT